MFFKSLKEKCCYFRELTDYKLLPNSYVLVMVDGRSFSKKIKNRFDKPFDKDFMQMMNETALYVCNNFQGVKFAYTQSDEISFVITDFDTPNTDAAFGYRLCKLQSIIASLATSKFNQLMTLYLLKNKVYDMLDLNKTTGKETYDAVSQLVNGMTLYEFDCKAWNVPNDHEVYSWFLFRQLDCIRNSKQQAAQSYLSHKELTNKNTDKQVALLLETHNIDWNNYSDGEKWGRFIFKVEDEIKGVDNNGVETTTTRKKFRIHDAHLLNSEKGKEAFFALYDVYPTQVGERILIDDEEQ